MNSTDFLQIARQSFRITVGAAASLVETLQDPQQRESTFSEFKTDFEQQVQQWASKGEVTEREARQMLERMFSQQNSPAGSEATPTEDSAKPSSTGVQSEIQDLTATVVALRQELEELRQSQSQ